MDLQRPSTSDETISAYIYSVMPCNVDLNRENFGEHLRFVFECKSIKVEIYDRLTWSCPRWKPFVYDTCNLSKKRPIHN